MATETTLREHTQPHPARTAQGTLRRMSEAEEKLNELRRVAAQIARLDKRRATLVQRRDQVIREARDAGATWVQMQDAGRFASSRSIRQSLDRSGRTQ